MNWVSDSSKKRPNSTTDPLSAPAQSQYVYLKALADLNPYERLIYKKNLTFSYLKLSDT